MRTRGMLERNGGPLRTRMVTDRTLSMRAMVGTMSRKRFMESVNEDNEVWSSGVSNRKPLTIRLQSEDYGLLRKALVWTTIKDVCYQKIDFSDRDKKTVCCDLSADAL